MPEQRCTAGEAHDRHEWYWRGILRRECPGLLVVQCHEDTTHIPHWHGRGLPMWCRGAGLAGVCAHGVWMLDECDDCPAGGVS